MRAHCRNGDSALSSCNSDASWLQPVESHATTLFAARAENERPSFTASRCGTCFSMVPRPRTTPIPRHGRASDDRRQRRAAGPGPLESLVRRSRDVDPRHAVAVAEEHALAAEGRRRSDRERAGRARSAARQDQCRRRLLRQDAPLLGSLVGVRDNPDHKTLQQIVPAELYARWMTLKTKYFGAGRGQQHRVVAADLRRDRALERSDQERRASRARTSRTMSSPPPSARSSSRWRRRTRSTSTIRARAVKDFKNGEMDDLDCFAKTLDRLDSDLDTMAERANAWATGDIATLRTLPDSDQREACIAAITGMDLARKRGIAGLARAHREHLGRRRVGSAGKERGDVCAIADYRLAREGRLSRQTQGEGLHGRGTGRGRRFTRRLANRPPRFSPLPLAGAGR